MENDMESPRCARTTMPSATVVPLEPSKAVAIYGNTSQDGYLPEIGRLLRLLSVYGLRAYVDGRFAAYLERGGVSLCGAESVDRFPDDCGAVISIGGDGTFLRAAQWVGTRELPILGLNTGHLGFLASYSIADMECMTEALARGEGTVERRMVLCVSGFCVPPDVWPYALNEVAVLKDESASMISVEAQIDGIYLADYRADGLIVATPTGSTAYNLSAGGPIMQPTLETIAMTPIAPHSLTLRPLVVDGSSTIRLRTSSRTGVSRVSLDGHSFVVADGSVLTISRAAFHALVVRRLHDDFADIMREKLLWGRRSQ